MGKRNAQLTVVIGQRGIGKTNRTIEQCYEAVRRGRKVLIYDCQDEFRHYIFRPNEKPHTIRPMYFKDVPRYTAQKFAEIRRTTKYLDTGEIMSIGDMQDNFAYVIKTFRNGILVAEDTNVYVSDNPKNDLMGALATLRQKGVDVILHFQLVGKAMHPKILGMLNYIRLHKTMVPVERYRKQIADDDLVDILVLAEAIVERRYYWGIQTQRLDDTGKFFSCLINLNDKKITGIFTEKEAKAAIAKYISDNPSRTINKEIKRLDPDGKKIYPTRRDAYDFLETKMLTDYFDFK